MRNTPTIALARPSWRGVQMLTLLSVLLCLLVVYTATWGHADGFFPRVVAGWGWKHTASRPAAGDSSADVVEGFGGSSTHPIAKLMRTAETHLAALVASNPMNLSDAAHRYREKRSRHPPPGFDKWYAYAKARDALVPETFFDQIYHDLGPFWGMPVTDVQRSVRGFSPKITVRGGVVDSDAKGSYERVSGLMGMLEELNKEGVEVPDVDLPLNVNEEIAMLVPWETMETAVEFARTFMPPLQDVVGAFSALEDNGMEEGIFDPEWLDNRMYHKVGGPYLGPRPLWSLVQPACPPKSATAKGELMVDIWHQGHTKGAHTVAALLPLELPANSSEGYVANWTMASDVCERPELQGLYGSFFAPKSMSVTQKLFPLFSASKISGSNEILIPTFSSFNTSTTASRLPWNEMEMELHWRGPASGGAASRLSWRRMHRHRFASMLNATHVEIAEAMLHAGNETTVGLGYAGNFRLLPANAYHLDTQKGGRMAEWVSGWADVGFTDLQCDEPGDNGTCPYSNEYFSVKEQPGDVKGQYKYTAVLDGDTGDDGGELVQRLVEGRVVLRASVYKQWVDARLVPWTHFVPLDNTLVDLYGIMEYFLGTAVPSSPPTFAHAHVEVEKHEHHFQTPHWDEEVEDVDGGGEGHEEHGRSVDVNEAQSDSGNGHDAQAQRIAEAGQQWAHQVLGRDDVLIYTYRLLLEYARVVDAKRHTMGWVGDLFVEGP